jgi:hypothetical protein
MANVKKGQTVPPPQWWKHLRDWKRIFWRKQRKADQKDTRKRLNPDQGPDQEWVEWQPNLDNYLDN